MTTVVVYPTTATPYPSTNALSSPAGSAGFAPLTAPGVGCSYFFNLQTACAAAGYGTLSTITGVRVGFDVQGAVASATGNNGPNYSQFSWNGQTWSNESNVANPPAVPHGGTFSFTPALTQGASIPGGGGEIDYWDNSSGTEFVGAPGNVRFEVDFTTAVAPPALTLANFSTSTKTLESPFSAMVGDTVTYHLNVINSGQTAGTAVLVDTSTNLSDVTLSPVSPITVAANSTTTVFVTGKAIAAGTVTNSYTINSGAPIVGGPVNVIAPPQAPVLSATKTAPAQATSGGAYSATVTVKNTGSDFATNVTVTDAPSWLTNVVIYPASLGIAIGAVGTFTVTGTIDSSVGSKVNTALVSCAEGATGTAYATTNVVGVPVLQVTKTGPSRSFAGRPITYSVLVKNTGTGPASALKLTDVCPEVAAITLTGGATSLAAGASTTFTVTGQMKRCFTGTVTNTATATCAEEVSGISSAKTEVSIAPTHSRIEICWETPCDNTSAPNVRMEVSLVGTKNPTTRHCKPDKIVGIAQACNMKFKGAADGCIISCDLLHNQEILEPNTYYRVDIYRDGYLCESYRIVLDDYSPAVVDLRVDGTLL
jgi:uncharacterized repeat protein (TIGR01451 family)